MSDSAAQGRERTADLIEVQVYLDPPLSFGEAVTQAEGIRLSLVRSGWNARVVDIRGEEDFDAE